MNLKIILVLTLIVQVKSDCDDYFTCLSGFVKNYLSVNVSDSSNFDTEGINGDDSQNRSISVFDLSYIGRSLSQALTDVTTLIKDQIKGVFNIGDQADVHKDIDNKTEIHVRAISLDKVKNNTMEEKTLNDTETVKNIPEVLVNNLTKFNDELNALKVEIERNLQAELEAFISQVLENETVDWIAVTEDTDTEFTTTDSPYPDFENSIETTTQTNINEGFNIPVSNEPVKHDCGKKYVKFTVTDDRVKDTKYKENLPNEILEVNNNTTTTVPVLKSSGFKINNSVKIAATTAKSIVKSTSAHNINTPDASIDTISTSTTVKPITISPALSTTTSTISTTTAKTTTQKNIITTSKTTRNNSETASITPPIKKETTNLYTTAVRTTTQNSLVTTSKATIKNEVTTTTVTQPSTKKETTTISIKANKRPEAHTKAPINFKLLENVKINEISSEDMSYYEINDDNSTDYPIIDYIDLYKDTTNEDLTYVPTVRPLERGDLENTIQDGELNADNGSYTNDTSHPASIFPWIAAIFIKNGTSNQFDYFCDGALMSNSTVLTAARCLQREKETVNADDVIVFLGKRSLQNMADGESIHKIKQIKLHPNFTLQGNIAQNDLAVLLLEDTVIFSEKIQPACLLEEGDTGNAVTTAWGEKLSLIRFIDKNKTCAENPVENTFCATYGNNVALCPSFGGVYASLQNGRWCLGGVRAAEPMPRILCFNREISYTNLRAPAIKTLI